MFELFHSDTAETILLSSQLPAIVLSEAEQTELRQVLATVPMFDVFNPDPNIFHWAFQAALQLPKRVLSALMEFRLRGNDWGTLLIKGLPIDSPLPLTPKDGRPSPEKTTRISEGVLLSVMSVIGQPISYQDEKEGALIQDVIPVQGKEEAQENTGSSFLEFHTEDGFHPLRPDFVALLGLRPDHERVARTATASIRQVLHKLPAHAIELLRQPLYKIRASSSFGIIWSRALPVLSGHLLDPDMVIDFYLMEALTAEAEWALGLLKRYLLQAAISVVLDAGDLILIDNLLAAHARTGFVARYDGYDRWLQRAFAVRDGRRLQAYRGLGHSMIEPLSVVTGGLE